MSQATKCLILLAVVAIFFITEIIPLAVTSTAASIACGILGFVPTKQVFSGLSNSTVVLFAGMFIVGAAMFYTGLAQKIGETVVKITGTGENSLMFGACCPGRLRCRQDPCFPRTDASGICLRHRRYHHAGRYAS